MLSITKFCLLICVPVSIQQPTFAQGKLMLKDYLWKIGKDGSEKLRRRELLPRRELYSVIDAMPMRRREMQESQN